MKYTHLRSRLATFGLLAVLLAFTFCSISSAAIIWETVAQADKAVHMSDLYQETDYLIRTQESLFHEYFLNPNDANQAALRTNTQQLGISFQSVDRDGSARDSVLIKSVLKEYSRYLPLINQFFSLMIAHHPDQASNLHEQKIDPSFTAIDTQISQATALNHQLTIQSLASLHLTLQITIVITFCVFIGGLFLFVLCWKIMHGYQRQIDEAKHAKLLQMELMASTDPLTSLPNHRTMMDRIEVELACCHSSGQPCALIFLDLDHFKQINDTWGHRAGDAVLREAGRRFKSNIRQEDAVGRYGGEEFVMVLTNTNLDEAAQVAERLRSTLAKDLCVIESEEQATTVNAIPVTASIGIAVYQEHGTTREALLEAADNAMYQAKQTGRNRVCLASEGGAFEQPVLTTTTEAQVADAVTQALNTIATLRDQGTSEHAYRMVKLAEATTRYLSRSEEEIHLIRLAALFHDIGKVGVPDAILHKPGALSEEEWTVMRRHPLFSQQVLTQAGGIFERLSHIVVAHHERWDGEGYPYGLAQHAIPLGSRILAVVDSYDAMTSQRPYRQPMSLADAQAELRKCAGKQYDPEVVSAFLQVLDADLLQQTTGELTRFNAPLLAESKHPDHEVTEVRSFS